MTSDASKLDIHKLKKNVERTEKIHDDVLISRGLGGLVTTAQGAPDGQPKAPIFTAKEPFDDELAEIPSYRKSRKKQKKEDEITQVKLNLFHYSTHINYKFSTAIYGHSTFGRKGSETFYGEVLPTHVVQHAAGL